MHHLTGAVFIALSVLFTAATTSVAAATTETATPQKAKISCKMLNERGTPIKPSHVTLVGDDLYLLDVKNIWCVPAGVKRRTAGKPLFAINAGPANPKVGNIPVQELSTFVFAPHRRSLVLLDKAGDIFEYFPERRVWSVLRPNRPFGSPDPEYLDMAATGENVILLDPERNQIWRFPATNQRYFHEVLPWRLKPGDISVADTVAIAYDGDTWVIRRNGALCRFKASGQAGLARQISFRWQPPKGIRPSRLFTDVNMPLYVVERENNRVIAVDKKSGAYKQYLFPAGSDLRGLVPQTDGFWIINGDHLEHRALSDFDPAGDQPHQRTLDERLAGLTIPLKGAGLPRHPGVWAGARRLYRHGVHHGTDFFHDPGAGAMVAMSTPVFAADAGKVIRADANFKDMTAAVYSRVIQQCYRDHESSEANENLLRGCQVWIDHGNGLITKYAHLDKIKPGLKMGTKIGRGDLVGYVGVSGTGENLPGRVKHPHLHFEIHLDNRYLGYGLTPSESIGTYEDIFGLLGSRHR